MKVESICEWRGGEKVKSDGKIENSDRNLIFQDIFCSHEMIGKLIEARKYQQTYGKRRSGLYLRN